MSSAPPYAPPPSPGRPWGAGRIIALVFGIILALLALGFLAAGCATLWADQTQRDSEEFLTTRTTEFESDGYALASERLDIDEETPSWLLSESFLGDFRVNAESTSGDDVFIGIGPADDVDAYLSGVAYSQVTDVNFDPFRPDYREVDGDAPAGPPGSETFWVAEASGSGEQTVTWEPERGDWSLLVMNADAAEGVEVDLSVGAEAEFLGWLAAGLLIAGLVLLGVAGLLLFLAVRPGEAGAVPAPAGTAVAPAAAAAPAYGGETAVTAAVPLVAPDYPVGVRGDLDPGLGRWLWLVKWLLVIPHVIVLVFLWIAFFVLTVVAFFAILFSGRYPRGIFDFNVGVIRWTWRVWFYSYWANGTDRYPPFSLASDPGYPADYDVAFPERLSRGLVLVKWWLLAIPHYILVAVFVGGWGWGWWWFWGDEDWDAGGSWPGLVGILVLIAVIILLFTGRYPRGIYDLVLGFDRWALRVAAYASLMRDEYPPFRLDTGPREPAAVAAEPPPSPAEPPPPAEELPPAEEPPPPPAEEPPPR